MNPDKRKCYLDTRVQNTFVVDGEVLEALESSEPSSSSTQSTPSDLLLRSDSSCLSVDVKSFAAGVSIPLASLEGIWKKAGELLSSADNMTLAPGYNSEARMVRSFTNARPHLVTPGKAGRFMCDSECANYKSLGICSHVVATAEANNKLIEFSNYYRKAKKVPNFTQIAKANVPTGTGRKGSVPPRKRKKTDQVLSRMPLAISDIENGNNNSNVAEVSVGDVSVQGCSFFSSINSSSSSSVVPPYYTSNYVPQVPLTPTPSPISPIPSSPYFIPPSTHPFKLWFLSGNISTCNGCLRKYDKPPTPPYDLVVQHEEWRNFVAGGVQQVKFGNAYYHCTPVCIQAKWPMFLPCNLQIPDDIRSSLTENHKIVKILVYQNFGISLA